jgi:hypothetical protein
MWYIGDIYRHVCTTCMTFKDALAVYAQPVVVHAVYAQPLDVHVAHMCLYRSYMYIQDSCFDAKMRINFSTKLVRKIIWLMIVLM